jgi:hypothetical protein
MPKKLYEPVERKGGELLWMDWQQSQDRSVCRGDPLVAWRINPASRVVRPFDRKLASLIAAELKATSLPRNRKAKGKTKRASKPKK